MSPPGRPKGEYRGAQHEGTPVRARCVLAALLLMSLAACDKPPAEPTLPAATSTDTVDPAPNDSELARRQAECEHAGQLVLQHASLDDTLSQSVSASYNPRSNRCLVELQTRPADPAKALDELTRTLFDGDTRDMLGTTKIEGKKRSALILETGVTDFDDANLYIDKQMSRQ